MGRIKHKRIAEAQAMPNILDYRLHDCRAKIHEFAQPGKRLVLELASGDGKYASEMAKMFPNDRFIGVDIQGERLWMGAKTSQKQENLLFLRAPIDRLNDYFVSQSVDEIWITFADPFPRKKQANKRLTSEKFLKIYKSVLKKQGILHLKTDNTGLFNYSVEEISRYGGNIKVCMENVDKRTKDPLLCIQTYFEKKARKIRKNIHYLNCVLS